MKNVMEPPTVEGVAVERQQGKNAIEAAIEKGITYFVYTSVGGLQDDYVAIAYVSLLRIEGLRLEFGV